MSTKNSNFLKFPKTKHALILAVLFKEGGVVPRGGVMPTKIAKNFLRRKLVIEEKLDGLHTGISFDSDGNLLVHSRESFVSPKYRLNFESFGEFFEPLKDKLFEVLNDRYILYGEWCRPRYRVAYDGLPGPFIGFDVFDLVHKHFLSTHRRNHILLDLGIPQVPKITEGSYCELSITNMLSKSRFSNDDAEGLYLRWENGFSLIQRAQILNPKYVHLENDKGPRRVFNTIKM